MNTGQKYFGMTLPQIGILAGLALIACIVIGFLGSVLLSTIPGMEQVQPTSTLVSSPTPILTTTPWPTITPIPDWREYTFAENKAKLWLPASYSGGDTATTSEAIVTELRAASDDEAFVNEIQGLIAAPEIVFFAFDSEPANSVRFMYVERKALGPDTSLSMDDYLNQMMDDFADGNDRVTGRQIVQLDHYPAGKLVVESKVPVGGAETYVTMAIYMIEADDTMWLIRFRTGREEFSDYQQTIETSAGSFWVER